jgi:hypothetical protein
MPKTRTLVSETTLPTAERLIGLIASGEYTLAEIQKACRLWLALKRPN